MCEVVRFINRINRIKVLKTKNLPKIVNFTIFIKIACEGSVVCNIIEVQNHVPQFYDTVFKFDT